MLRNSRRLLKQPQISLFSICNYSNDIKSGASENETPKTDTNGNKSEKRLVPKRYDPRLVTKEDMKWRTAWHEQEGERFSFLRTFYKEDSSSTLMGQWLGNFDFTHEGFKKWVDQTNKEARIQFYSYLPERNRVLGDELAAAHFVVSRGGAIKFIDEDRWIKADERGNYGLPNKATDQSKYLEAIDCTDMNIVYEGLSNFRNLKELKWLSFNGCQNIDDWCLDAIANMFSETLIYLDLRDCRNISYRGLGALAKMNNLKILYLDDFYRATIFELTCLLLEEQNTSLQIRSDPVTFEI